MRRYFRKIVVGVLLTSLQMMIRSLHAFSLDTHPLRRSFHRSRRSSANKACMYVEDLDGDDRNHNTKERFRKEAENETANQKRNVSGSNIENGWITNRTVLPRLWNSSNSDNCFKILSWNVNGLRAVLRNDPKALSSLAVEQSFPDVICLQETKLQEIHIDDPKLGINNLLKDEGYESHWSCSTAKKGYSGTAVFIRTTDPLSGTKVSDDRIPISVQYGIDCVEHDQEGRSITVHFSKFSIANLYVPNSGQKLERLSYRMQWDKDLLSYIQQIESSRNVPVLWLGDLNVAHRRLDVYNYGAKHLLKQAGCTLEEIQSFTDLLKAGYKDALRTFHPDAQGQYTYWSTRTKAREPNKGLRLDYFVCSEKMFDDLNNESDVAVRDSYVLDNYLGSDHCPIVLEMELLC